MQVGLAEKRSRRKIAVRIRRIGPLGRQDAFQLFLVHRTDIAGVGILRRRSDLQNPAARRPTRTVLHSHRPLWLSKLTLISPLFRSPVSKSHHALEEWRRDQLSYPGGLLTQALPDLPISKPRL